VDPHLADGKAPGIYLLTFPEPADLSFRDDDVDEADLAATPDPLVPWVERAFADGYSVYERVVGPKLDPRYGSAGALPIEQLPFPSMVVGIEAEWRPKTKDTKERKKEYIEFEEVVFDGDLLVTLLELYIIDGWQPIAEIGEQLATKLDKLRKSVQPPSGGTPEPTKDERELEVWQPAETLFRLARNGVGLLVRREVARIETMAGIRVEAHVADSREQFSQLSLADLTNKSMWNKQMETGKVRIRDYEEEVERFKGFTLVDQKLAADLKSALEEPVRCRRLLDLTLKELANLPLQPPPGEGGTGSGPGGGGGPGGGTGSGRSGGTRVSVDDAVVRARQLADALKEFASKNLPSQQLLYLVLPALNPGFSTSDMEEKLSAAIGEITAHFALLTDRIHPDRPHTQSIDVTGQPPTWVALHEAATPDLGAEREAVNMAIHGLADGDVSWVPLLSAKTWNELVERGDIQADSFTYVTYAHYLQTLNAGLSQQNLDERESQRFWLQLSRIAAAASLISLLIPPTAPVLRAPAWVLDLVLMFSSVWSVTGQLDRIHGLLGQTVAESSPSIDAFGQVGDLLAARGELLDDLGETAVITLVTSILARVDPSLVRTAGMRATLEITKWNLAAYGYYQDIQILLTSDNGKTADEET
jgi:hypothetical protein